MHTTFDRTKTLQELENDDWGESTFNSYLVTTVHALRRKPLNEFTVEDLRLMISQEVGLAHLVPLAIEQLAENPLAAGDFYRGDLLLSVLGVQLEFWREHQDLWWEVEKIVFEVESLRQWVDDTFMPAAEVFRRARKDR